MDQVFNAARVVIVLIFFFIRPVSADLKINEVYPYPNADEEEWVEIYNDSDQETDLTSFILKDLAGNNINLSGNKINPKGFLTSACKNILNNSGDTVSLIDNTGNEIDSFTYTQVKSGQSAGYCPDGQNNLVIFDIPTKNTVNNCILPPTPGPTVYPGYPSVISTVSPIDTLIITDIYLSEVLPAPGDDNNEWVEIYNNNPFDVVLNNWYLDDVKNSGSSPKIFSLTIKAKEYKIIELTSNIFNNDADIVRLLDSQQNEKDSFGYEDPQTDKTFGRTDFNQKSICLQNPSPNQANNNCISQQSTINTSNTSPLLTQNTGLSITAIPSQKNTPDISESLNPKLLQKKVIYVNYLSNQQNSLNHTANTNPKVLGILKNQPQVNNQYYEYIRFLICLSFYFSGLNILYIIYKINRT